jgi:soluble lytic murein transglycosylase-like protein
MEKIAKMLCSLCALMSCAAQVGAQTQFSAPNGNSADVRRTQVMQFHPQHGEARLQSAPQEPLLLAPDVISTEPGPWSLHISRNPMSPSPTLDTVSFSEVTAQLRGNFTKSRKAEPSALRALTPYSPSPADCRALGHKPANFLSNKAQQRRQLLYPLVQQAACRHRIPVDLFDALIMQESAYDISARSPVGAFGLAQLMPATARDLGADQYSVRSNLDGGARYLKAQLSKFASAPLALAAYNAGPARVAARWAVPNISETRYYVASIIAKWQRLSVHQPLRLLIAPAAGTVTNRNLAYAANAQAPKNWQQATRSIGILQF